MTTIMGQKAAQHVAAGRNVLLMNSPHNETDAVKRIRTEAHDCLYLEFHDIPSPRPGLVHPEFHHVEQAIEWAKDKNVDDLICVCQMGVSRSSAMAFVLNTAVKGPHEAVKILDPYKHLPNRLIVAMGADILGDNDRTDVATKRQQLRDHWNSLSFWEKHQGLGRYNPFGGDKYAREIMQVFREYSAIVDDLYSNDLPLEIIEEHEGQDQEEILEAIRKSNEAYLKTLR